MLRTSAAAVRVKVQPLPLAPPRGWSWIVQRHRVLLDPWLNVKSVVPLLDVLPLITDLVAVADPTDENLIRWHFNRKRFRELSASKVFLPIFSAHTKGREVLGLGREQLLPDPDFFAEYQEAVADDLDDDRFVELSRKLMIDPKDSAFSINWDLIVSQLLGAPLATSSNMLGLLNYKIQKSIKDLKKTADVPLTIRKGKVLMGFLNRVISVLPSELSVREILEFRKDNRSANFREWFHMELLKMGRLNKSTKIREDEEIYRDFRELLQSMEGKINRLSGTFTVATGVAGSALAGQLSGAAPALAGPYVFPRIIRRIWKKVGRRNWVFILLDFHSRPRL